MTTLHKAAQMALDALERSFSSAMVHALKARIPECGDFAGIAQDLDFSLAALREALEAPEPEPVAWRYGVPKLNGVEWRYTLHKTRDDATPLYAAPPAAPDHLRDVAGNVAPAAPVVLQLWCPETGELCGTCSKTGTCEASMIQAHGIGGGNG